MARLPAAASINAAWLIPALLAALTAVLTAAAAWPIRAIVRRRFQAPNPLAGRALRIWRLSRVFAWLVLLSVAGWVGLIMAFSGDPGVLGGSLDWLILSLPSSPVADVRAAGPCWMASVAELAGQKAVVDVARCHPAAIGGGGARLDDAGGQSICLWSGLLVATRLHRRFCVFAVAEP